VNTIRLSCTFIAAAALLWSSLLTAPVSSATASATPTTTTAARQAVMHAHNMRASTTDKKHRLRLITLWELARARRATARYNDVDNAIAAGYVDVNLYTPGEGHHYVKESLIDGTFDLTKPEALLYADHGEDGLRLVAVEYLSPDSAPPPEGFTGDADVWQSEPPFPVWMVNAWIWLYNPNGVFAFANPRVP
jgi:hypothetical protein